MLSSVAYLYKPGRELWPKRNTKYLRFGERQGRDIYCECLGSGSGHRQGTVTDARGEFNIRASKFDSLVFSSVGYLPITMVVGNNRVLNVVLEAEQNSMNEVVVVGFGRQRKISVVGAQSTVNPEELNMPVSNINTLLAGRLSGVIGVQRGGQPGRSSADIWIRGISTFGGGSSAPLILVDGVQRDINNIDPQDVASFTVLKMPPEPLFMEFGAPMV
ncbi:TonB-dependent receptor [Niabella sp. W65]|nr:TonB-dependent receptor [Niabella sp. W65]MCH7363222.1 TonB-dependent receptor [Niabella sp. W65]ULT39149.1 TonB-dependent receptor [Niabella sp. I65]